MIATSLRSALLTAVVAALLGLALSLPVALAFGPDLVRSVLRVWLVAHGSGLSVGAAAVTVVPVGALAVSGLVTAAAARWVVVEPLAEPSAFAAGTGGFLGVFLGIASAATSANGVHTSLPRAALGGFVVGLVGSAVGYAVRHGLPRAWWPADRPRQRLVLASGGVAASAVLAASAVVVLGFLVARASRVGDLWAALHPGLAGGLTLVVVNVLALPTLIVWVASALLGPGFALGVHTSVDLTGVHVGTLPAMPILGALPGPGEFGEWVFVLGIVPLAAGILAGLRVARHRPGDRLAEQLALGAAAGAVGGALLGVLCALSSGAVGPGRMSEVGPDPVVSLLVAVPVLAAGGALGTAAAHYRVQRVEANRRPGLGSGDESAGTD